MAPQGNDEEVKIDVSALANEMAEILSKQSLFMPPGCCIFQVPSILSRHNSRAYVPNAFSIGPFHYKKLPLIQATQKIKLKYLQELISRPWASMEGAGRDAKLIALTEAVESVREDARECYAGKLSLCESEFVQVLVFDGCFLVELFRKYFNRDLVSGDDPVFSMSCLLQYLYHDLIVLENQIPWIVLEPLFEMTKPIDVNEESLAKLVVDFFSNFFQETPPLVKPEALAPSLKGSKHILDLLRNLLVNNSKMHKDRKCDRKPIPSATRSRKVGTKFASGSSLSVLDVELLKEGVLKIPSATRLREAGIKFSCVSSSSILDVEFLSKKGVLKIPQLFIQETTETVLRNLICLEQCCPGYEPVVTSYAILMDNLINTEADMELLMKRGVVKNWLNIDDATKFFNNLYDDTCINENCYDKLTWEVSKYCKRSWPRYCTVLRQDYFRHPWMLISVIAAALLLVLTFLQTLFAIIK